MTDGRLSVPALVLFTAHVTFCLVVVSLQLRSGETHRRPSLLRVINVERKQTHCCDTEAEAANIFAYFQ